MRCDTMERMGHTLIQHGPFNDRIYIIHLAREDCPKVLPELDRLARDRGYSKIVGKIPGSLKPQFADRGYEVEAAIPGYYRGTEDALYVGLFLEEDRRRERAPELVDDVLQVAREKAGTPTHAQEAPEPPGGYGPEPQEGYGLETLGPDNATEMAEAYAEVFASYPFPIHDPAFLVSTMDTVDYYGLRHSGRLATLASADRDTHAMSVEMTDFATLPGHGGKGLAAVLLRYMERDVAHRGYQRAFTIARSRSYAMNITFARAHYEFCGRLTNNSNISGNMESMNIWSKPL